MYLRVGFSTLALLKLGTKAFCHIWLSWHCSILENPFPSANYIQGTPPRQDRKHLPMAQVLLVSPATMSTKTDAQAKT